MLRSLPGATTRRSVRVTLGLVLAGSCLFPPSPARAAGLPGPVPVADPDAAAGLEDPGWTPAPGSIRVATLPSGLGGVPVGAPGRFSARGMEDGFGWQGGTTHLFTYCVFPSKHDAKMADIKGCFSARRFDERATRTATATSGRVFASSRRARTATGSTG